MGVFPASAPARERRGKLERMETALVMRAGAFSGLCYHLPRTLFTLGAN